MPGPAGARSGMRPRPRSPPNRARARCARTLEGAGIRLQRSVFLLADGRKVGDAAILEAAGHIDPATDAMGAWSLCAYCLASARWWGTVAPSLPGPCVIAAMPLERKR